MPLKRRRASAETTQDRALLDAREHAARLAARLDAYDDGIERLLATHRPRFSYARSTDGSPRLPDDLRPGNSRNKTTFTCVRCGTHWPCCTFNELRDLYGQAHDWPAASEPYEILTLHRRKTETKTEESS